MKTGAGIRRAEARYDATTVVLHWATAVIVIAMWIVGQTTDYLPKHSLVRSFVWSSHVAFGFALAALLAFRVFWRSTSGHRLPDADVGVLHVMAKTTHYLLYALLTATVALGIANAFVRGYDMYRLFHLPQIGDEGWKRPITEWHGLVADALLVLAGLHAFAALVHHYAWHDHLIGRMSLKGRSMRSPDI